MTSFDFTWSDAVRPSGKVFGRKRPAGSKASVRPKEVEGSPSKTRTEATTQREEGQPSEPSARLVKRKRKKDKLVAETSSGGKQVAVERQTVNKTQTVSHSLFSVRRKEVYVDTDVKGKAVVETVFSAEKKFSHLEIHKHLLANLEKNSFTTLTKVQEMAISVIMSGKNVLVRSQTGSGKTLAYAVPIMDSLLKTQPRLQRSDGVQAMVVVPTRELALQTHELFGRINSFQWLVVSHLCGGENRKTEKDRLRKGIHVLIGTPGRLLDHILHTTALKTQNVRCLVLDEADRLLDMGFKRDIVKIVEELEKARSHAGYDPIAMLRGPKEKAEEENEEEEQDKSGGRQTVLLSATLTKGIAELADFTMKEHTYVDTLDGGVGEGRMVIPETVRQEFVVVYAKHRLFTLAAVLLAMAKGKVFVFMATTQMVNYHHELFTRYLARMPTNRGKLRSGEVVVLDDLELLEDSEDEEETVMDTEFFKLHGNMDQEDRKKVFTEFRKAKKGILLCTDVAARGVDVPEADCIVQYTGPQTDDDYLHRVGRTGRVGKSGSALIFLTHEEQEYVSRLQDNGVYLKRRDPEEYLSHLCVLMDERDGERAASAVQRRFETALSKDKELHKMACVAYSSWSRFYNTYPHGMRAIFDFKNVNLGHYVTSFGLRETPSVVARTARSDQWGTTSSTTPRRRQNRNLAVHSEENETKQPKKRKIGSVSLTTSEYSSGLAPIKKKRKKN